MKQRNGVLGLETSKQAFISFLILAVTAVAILLSLTAVQNSVSTTIDTSTQVVYVTGEEPAWINTTTYTLTNYNSSWSNPQITAVYNSTDSGVGHYNYTILSGNYTLSSVGVLSNATTTTWGNVSLNYYYTLTYDTGRTDNIIGNISGGLQTFFASTGTIFSILIVVVIILAISIIIWAVGRFGQRMDEGEAVNL